MSDATTEPLVGILIGNASGLDASSSAVPAIRRAGAVNAALMAVAILGLSDGDLRARFGAYRPRRAERLAAARKPTLH